MAENPLKDAVKAAISIRKTTETEVHLVVGTTREEVDRLLLVEADTAHKAGHTVTWANGLKTWIATEADFEEGEHVWDEDGDRIRCTRKLVHFEDGVRTEYVIRRVWRHYDAHYEDEK